MRTVKQYSRDCEDWGHKHHKYSAEQISMTAENLIDEIREELRVGNHLLAVATDRQRDLELKNDKLEEALRRIDDWAKAYPLKIFPKPDLEKAAGVLKASGMTLDSISADSMRHVLDGVKGIVTDALADMEAR